MANTGNNRFQQYSPGISHVGSYQVSGKPFMTGSTDIDNDVPHKISFPQVAKIEILFRLMLSAKKYLSRHRAPMGLTK